MTRVLSVALAMLLLAGCAGVRAMTATQYRPANLLGGYSERIPEPGLWRVTGRSNAMAGEGFGSDMAMHRAAELVKAAGFSHMQILDQRGNRQTMNRAFIGESMALVVRGTDSPAPPADCRARTPRSCFTVEVDVVLARLRPGLHIDPEPAGK
jgi:hypothetical protein